MNCHSYTQAASPKNVQKVLKEVFHNSPIHNITIFTRSRKWQNKKVKNYLDQNIYHTWGNSAQKYPKFQGPGGVGGGVWLGYDQDTLHTCMKLSKNKQKNILKKKAKHPRKMKRVCPGYVFILWPPGSVIPGGENRHCGSEYRRSLAR